MSRPDKTTASGFSIRLALNSLLLASIVATAVGIGVSAFLNARATVELLWEDLSSQIAETAVEKTLRYLETGPTALAANRSLYEAGWLDLAAPESMLEYLLTGLRARPNVTWYSFAGVDGVYLSAFRVPSGAIHLTWRQPLGDGRTRHRDYRVEDNGGWEPIRDDLDSNYDPRVRTWWATAVKAEGPVWSKPFLFVTRNQPGFMCVERQRDAQGDLVGVWAVEYEMSVLSRFVADMRVVDNGRVYLITNVGRVVGHPDGWTTEEAHDRPYIARAADHRDRLLAKTYALGRGQAALGGVARFGFSQDGQRYLAVYERFPEETGIPWSVGVVVAEDDLFGKIYSNNRMAAIIAGMVALGTFMIGAVIIRAVARPLNAIAGDLDRIGKLELSNDDTPAHGTFVREVSSMMLARDRMKGGLRSFAKYVPAELVRDLMDSGQEAALGVESRNLTVFFADIADFTTIAEQLDPNTLSELLGEYFEEMSTIISASGGTVDKYIGDAVMAFWGAPREAHRHPEAACRAALDCHDRLSALRKKWRAQGRPPLRARIGINSGVALVGNVGSERRMNYTVIGDTVNLASRIEGLCKIYGLEMALGSRTKEAAEASIVVRPIDRVAVRGRVSGEVIFELLALRDDATESQLELAEVTAQSFAAYQRRDFAAAISGYERVLQLRPGDVTAALLLERCRELLAVPPDADWTGVHVLTRKK